MTSSKGGVAKITLCVICSENSNIIKIITYEISQFFKVIKNQEINGTKFWDFVGDLFLEAEVEKIQAEPKNNKDLYLIVPCGNNEGDYYSEDVIRMLLDNLPDPTFYIF